MMTNPLLTKLTTIVAAYITLWIGLSWASPPSTSSLTPGPFDLIAVPETPIIGLSSKLRISCDILTRAAAMKDSTLPWLSQVIKRTENAINYLDGTAAEPFVTTPMWRIVRVSLSLSSYSYMDAIRHWESGIECLLKHKETLCDKSEFQHHTPADQKEIDFIPELLGQLSLAEGRFWGKWKRFNNALVELGRAQARPEAARL